MVAYVQYVTVVVYGMVYGMYHTYILYHTYLPTVWGPRRGNAEHCGMVLLCSTYLHAKWYGTIQYGTSIHTVCNYHN